MIIENESKSKGSLLAGALGDSLGYSIENYTFDDIKKEFGKKGIILPKIQKNGKSFISDDTQMTLYTAEALINNGNEKNIKDKIYNYYLDWLGTQLDILMPEALFEKPNISKLIQLEGMNNVREPGMTCIYSLLRGIKGSINLPINDSKGSGGIMRNAPIGIYYGSRKDKSIEEISELSAEISALTHGHELGYIPSYCETNIIVRIMRNSQNEKLRSIIEKSIVETEYRFRKFKYIDYFIKTVQKALDIIDSSKEKRSDNENIKSIGQGWVAEETLSIAIYSSLKYENSIKEALISSVNHDGDSDSTGAVTGNIIGAYLGYDYVPNEWLKNLELKDTIEGVAKQLV